MPNRQTKRLFREYHDFKNTLSTSHVQKEVHKLLIKSLLSSLHSRINLLYPNAIKALMLRERDKQDKQFPSIMFLGLSLNAGAIQEEATGQGRKTYPHHTLTLHTKEYSLR